MLHVLGARDNFDRRYSVKWNEKTQRLTNTKQLFNSIQPLKDTNFRSPLEALCIERRNSTPHLPRYQSEEMKNIKYFISPIKVTSCQVYDNTLRLHHNCLQAN